VVLEILSRNNALQVGHVKEYIVEWISKQKSLIEANERSIVVNEQRIEQMEREMDDLANKVQVFQTNKCFACKSALQLPAVHFLCKHSFHVHCFEEYSGTRPDQCPACAGGGDGSGESSGRQPPSKGPTANYQRFRSELADSTDTIALISKYIGEGAFD